MKKERGFLLLVIVSSLFIISFISAQSETGVEFTTGGYYCEKVSLTATWVNNALGIREVVGPSPDVKCDKYSADSIPSCCPTGFTCVNATGLCEDGSRITDCTKYRAQVDCNRDDMQVGIVSISNSSDCGLSGYFNSGSETCVNYTKCGCVWDTNGCSAKKRYTLECPSGPLLLGNCSWSTFSIVNEDCSNSNLPITISSKATWQPGTGSMPSDCSDITRTYPCVSTAKLPFFTPFSFILSAISIILVYGILLNSRKKK